MNSQARWPLKQLSSRYDATGNSACKSHAVGTNQFFKFLYDYFPVYLVNKYIFCSDCVKTDSPTSIPSLGAVFENGGGKVELSRPGD